MRLKKVGGLLRASFVDGNGVGCHLQESSAVERPFIWLGCDEPDPRHLVPGQGWQPVPLPEPCVCNTAMHLTRRQVKALLPYLQQFVATGSIGR